MAGPRRAAGERRHSTIATGTEERSPRLPNHADTQHAARSDPSDTVSARSLPDVRAPVEGRVVDRPIGDQQAAAGSGGVVRDRHRYRHLTGGSSLTTAGSTTRTPNADARTTCRDRRPRATGAACTATSANPRTTVAFAMIDQLDRVADRQEDSRDAVRHHDFLARARALDLGASASSSSSVQLSFLTSAVIIWPRDPSKNVRTYCCERGPPGGGVRRGRRIEVAHAVLLVPKVAFLLEPDEHRADCRIAGRVRQPSPECPRLTPCS